MADAKLTLTVVTPERPVVEAVPCETVSLPGAAGELGILPGHTPLISILGVGKVTWRDGATGGAVAVRGGFLEVAGDVVRVLADEATVADTVDAGAAQLAIREGDGKRLGVVGQEQLDVVNAEIAYAEAQLTLVSAAGGRG